MKPGGLLFTFSCSQAVDDRLFTHTIIAAAIQSNRTVRIIHRLHQPADHPVSAFHPEGAYLKGACIAYRLVLRAPFMDRLDASSTFSLIRTNDSNSADAVC